MTAPDPAARAALLRRLPRDGFVPPDAAAPWSPAARAAVFAAEVEAFAVAFWGLAPDERRRRYNALRETRYGPAAARLAEFESGLDATGGAGRSCAALARELYITLSRAAHRTTVEAEVPDYERYDEAGDQEPLDFEWAPDDEARRTEDENDALDRRDTQNAWFIVKAGAAVSVLLLALGALGALLSKRSP